MTKTATKQRILAIRGKLAGARPLGRTPMDCAIDHLRQVQDMALAQSWISGWSSAVVRDRECLPLWALTVPTRSTWDRGYLERTYRVIVPEAIRAFAWAQGDRHDCDRLMDVAGKVHRAKKVLQHGTTLLSWLEPHIYQGRLGSTDFQRLSNAVAEMVNEIERGIEGPIVRAGACALATRHAAAVRYYAARIADEQFMRLQPAPHPIGPTPERQADDVLRKGVQILVEVVESRR